MVEGGPQRVLEEVRPLNLGVEVVEEDLIQEEVVGVEVLLRAGAEEEEEEESQQQVGEEEGEAQWLPPVEEEVGEEAEEQEFHRAVEEVEVVVTEPQDQWAEVQVQPHSGLVRQEQAPGHILPL